MRKFLLKYLGINHDLEQQRYIATQAQLAQLTRGLTELHKATESLTDSTQRLLLKANSNSAEIDGLKEALEYHTKELVGINMLLKGGAKGQGNARES